MVSQLFSSSCIATHIISQNKIRMCGMSVSEFHETSRGKILTASYGSYKYIKMP